jgi:Tol biopolymer transport system component
VAFVAGIGEDREIYVHDLRKGTDRRLTFEPGVHDVPRWLGNDRILYATRIGMKSKVRLRAADGSGTFRDLHHEGGVGQGSAVLETTPDGREFLQVIDAVGRGQVRRFEVPAEGLAGEGRRVLQGEPDPDVLQMRVSPDGRLMAYVSDVGLSAYEVFLTRFPSGDGTWQVSTRGGRVPRWDPGTGALYYVSDAGTGQRSLITVEIHPEEDVPVGSQRTLFDLPQRGVALYGFGGFYEIAPGGDRILLVRRNSEEDRGTDRMVLVQNWRSEFERMVRERQ